MTSGLKEAQVAYDSMEPPEERDALVCPECCGSGRVEVDACGTVEECPLCGGEGSLR